MRIETSAKLFHLVNQSQDYLSRIYSQNILKRNRKIEDR